MAKKEENQKINDYVSSAIQQDVEKMIPLNIKEDKRVSIKDVVELVLRGFKDRFFKSHLSHRNIKGIIRARINITYMKEMYDIDLFVENELIDAKLDTVWSYNGMGMDRLIQIIESMQDQNLINMTEEKKGIFKR